MSILLPNPAQAIGQVETLAAQVMAQQCERGGSVLYIVPESTDIDAFIARAYQHHRWQDVRLIHPGDASLSNTYNPWFSGNISQKIKALLPGVEYSDPVIQALPEKANFLDIYHGFKYPERLLDTLPQASGAYRSLKHILDHGVEFKELCALLKICPSVPEVPEMSLLDAFGQNFVTLMILPKGGYANVMLVDVLQTLASPALQIYPQGLLVTQDIDPTIFMEVTSGIDVQLLTLNQTEHSAFTQPLVCQADGMVRYGAIETKLPQNLRLPGLEELCFPHFS